MTTTKNPAEISVEAPVHMIEMTDMTEILYWPYKPSAKGYRMTGYVQACDVLFLDEARERGLWTGDDIMSGKAAKGYIPAVLHTKAAQQVVVRADAIYTEATFFYQLPESQWCIHDGWGWSTLMDTPSAACRRAPIAKYPGSYYEKVRAKNEIVHIPLARTRLVGDQWVGEASIQ